MSTVSAEITKHTKAVVLPAGVELVNGGAFVQQSSDFMDLGMTMLASIGLVYLIMVLTFKTLKRRLRF